MSGEVVASPKREHTPSSTAPLPSIPQKRPLEDDHHQPAVSSPLNPEFKPAKTATIQEDVPFARDRAPRTKKESLKKREGGERSTPEVKAPKPSKKKVEKAVIVPVRFLVPTPKLVDFEVPQGAISVPAHTRIGPDGKVIQYHDFDQ